MKRCLSEADLQKKFEPPGKKMKPYIGDPKLLPRVQQYLEARRDHKLIDISVMADDLQSRYGEYGRKKRAAFKKNVEKAYEHILQMGHSSDALRKRQVTSRPTDNSDEESPDFSDDNQDYVNYEDSNAMNSLMRNFYSKPGSRPGSRPVSQPCSGASTPMGGRSPHRPSDSDTAPTPLFTKDRTGSKGIKDGSSTTKSKTPVSSPKPKAKAGPVANLQQQLGIADFLGNNETKPKTPESANEQTISKMDTTDGSLERNYTPNKGHKEDASQLTPKQSAKSEEPVSRPSSKKRRKQDPETDTKKKGPEITHSKITFADVGGNDKTLTEVCKLLVHMKHPEVYKQLGVTPPRGLLLHGPPGCGKTLLAHAIAGELDLPFMKIAATEIVSGVSGESEEKVRDTFQKAISNAPCVLFLDEIDAITQKRENASKDMERRIVSQLLTCMDELNNCETGHVLVIGATNRPDSLDPALRRAGRFDREISLGIPDQAARERILSVLCRPLRLAPNLDLTILARLTPGYVGADLTSLAREAAINAVNRVFKALQSERNTDKVSNTQNTDMANDSSKDTTLAGTDFVPVIPNLTDTEVDSVREMADVSEENRPLRSDEQSSTVALGDQGEQQKDNVTNDSSIVKPCGTSQHCESMDTMDSTSDTREKGGAFFQQLQQSVLKTKTDSQDLATVLSWLKDQPPLTEEQLEHLWIEMSDFEAAVQVVQPSAKREGFATVPDVTWSDIGALHNVREELQMAILAPVRHPEQFSALGLTSPPGVLLAGPPGCGKTLLAKAVANESGINFISVKGPELLNMYVGESERAVRQVFQRARNSSPCVIFFDELDALCPRRSDGGEGGSSVRVVNQLLTEMDGLEDRKQVFIMGATNRPDIIDPAVLRPGRLDKTLYVGLPGPSDRHDILRTITKNGTKPQLTPDIDLNAVACDTRCEGYTGADLAALVREASVTALRQFMASPQTAGQTVTVVAMSHFDTAFSKIKPSVSEKDKMKYDRMNQRLQPS